MRRAAAVYAGIGALAILVCIGALHGVAQAVLYDAIGLSSVAALLVGGRRNRPPRPLIWSLLALGQLLFVLGDVFYNVLLYGFHREPFPSPADGLYLLAYPVLAIGMTVLIRGRRAGRDRAGFLDAAILATGVGALGWTFLVSPTVTDSSITLTGRLISAGYPVGDLLLLAVLLRLITLPGATTVAFRLLVFGAVALLGADAAYLILSLHGSYTEGGPVDVAYLTAYLAWGAAALHPSMRTLSEPAPDEHKRLSPLRLAALGAASLVAPAILLYQGARGQPIDVGGIVIAAVLLFLLVVARLAGLVRQVEDQAVQLAALARNDGLTGIPNRRTWDAELSRHCANARRDGSPLCVVIIDLDHFKAYNDTHGHQGGDQLLKTASATWAAALRPMDVLARYGGEEFGLLLPATEQPEAVAIADRLRAATPLGATISAGVARWDGTEDPGAMVARADAALYNAKRGGRNQIAAAQADTVPVTPTPRATVS
jgi:diguanylate cyclase (GGDEF)-like protein